MAQDRDYASLRANAFAMAALQIANVVLPILLVPYLTRALGLRAYGAVAFGLGVCQLATVVTDYGFGLSATYHVARRRDRPVACARLLGAVSTCKALLALLVVTVIACYVAVSDQDETTKTFLLLMLLPIVAQAVQPTWFLIGIERMGWLAALTASTRFLHVLLVFLFVAGPADYWLIAISLGVANAVLAVASVLLVWRIGYRYELPRARLLWAVCKGGSSFFLSRASVAAYTSLGTVFLGFAGSALQVAFYSAAEQVYKAAQSTAGMLSQAIYPYLVRTKDYYLARKLLKLTVLVSMAGSVVMYFSSEYLVVWVFGDAFLPAAEILDLFSVTFLVTAPSVLLGYPVLGALGRLDVANRSVMIAGLVQVVGLGLLAASSATGAIQVAGCVLAAELTVLCIRGYWARKLIPRPESRVEAA